VLHGGTDKTVTVQRFVKDMRSMNSLHMENRYSCWRISMQANQERNLAYTNLAVYFFHAFNSNRLD